MLTDRLYPRRAANDAAHGFVRARLPQTRNHQEGLVFQAGTCKSATTWHAKHVFSLNEPVLHPCFTEKPAETHLSRSGSLSQLRHSCPCCRPSCCGRSKLTLQ